MIETGGEAPEGVWMGLESIGQFEEAVRQVEALAATTDG